MKRTVFLASLMMLVSCFAMAQSHEVTTTNKNGEKVVYEISDAANNRGDTLSIVTYSGESAIAESYPSASEEFDMENFEMNGFDGFLDDLGDVLPSDKTFGEAILALSIILFCIFVLPIIFIIVLIVLIYKNRRAKYKMEAEMAKNAAQNPSGVHRADAAASTTRIRSPYTSATYDKGIKNLCIGLGVAILLYTLTGRFALACIGILVMLNGASQVIIGKRHENDSMKGYAPEEEEKTKQSTSESKPKEEPSAEEITEVTEITEE